MIRYTLKCSNDHRFESWFRSAETFDDQCTRGLVSCPDCGSPKVSKAIMAPRVRPARFTPETSPQSDAPDHPPTPEQMETAIAKLRAEVEANSDDVGTEFASEARKIHTGEAPERAIHGEAKPDEARALIEDGIPVLPLPFKPKRKMN